MEAFLQQGPAQTVNYMIAGYVVIFGVIALYLVSLVVRQRNLLQDLETLQALDQQSQ
jgi:CcmD family protein